MRLLWLMLLLLPAFPAAAESFDVVLVGGRVMDPETGLDAPRNVGIMNGRIARITTARAPRCSRAPVC